MFGGLGLVLIALVLLPILTGVVAWLFFLSIPRLRFVATYSAFVPLAGASGLIGGLIAGNATGGPISTDTIMAFRQSCDLRGQSPSR